MHVIQYVFAQADSSREAFDSVKSYLEAQMEESATWYDWFVCGGGRWASKEEAQYDDNFMEDVAHQSDPKFQEYIETAKKYRKQELDQYKSEIGDLDISAVITSLDTTDVSNSDYSISQKLYALKRIYEMTVGRWDYDSYFYDIESESANMMWVQKSIDNGDTNWYAIPVDFHF